MSWLLNRRRFLHGSIATAASVGVSAIHSSALGTEEYIEAIVIGSGFGGAVASLRLGEAGIETIVLERGRRWEITDAGNTFCTYQQPDGRSSWLSPTTVLTTTPIDVYTQPSYPICFGLVTQPTIRKMRERFSILTNDSTRVMVRL